jgi:hypothetical protein
MKKNYFLLSLALLSFKTYAQEYKAPVSSAISLQPAQPGAEAVIAIDGNYTTNYHSKWNQKGIPDQLDFMFSDKVKSLKSLIYYPRNSGTNGIWTNVEVYYSTKDVPNDFKLITKTPLTWAGDSTPKKLNFDSEIINPSTVRIKINSALGDFSSAAEVEFFSSEEIINVTGSECNLPTDEFVAFQDTKITPNLSGSSASNFQPEENIENSFDNDINTLYHSNYDTSPTAFPISLIYNFDGNTPLDYLIYIPRQDGGYNGNIGKVKVSYNTAANPNYVEIKSFDFLQENKAKRLNFGSQIKPANIKIEVLDGVNSFASIAEMEFYTTNPSTVDTSSFKALFKDNIYSGLNSGVTQQQINTIPSPFYKALAQCYLDGKYKTNDRVKEHVSYKPITTINKDYKLANYNAFENPTGIVFSKDKLSIVIAENIPAGETVSLRIRDFASEANVTDSNYQLVNGVNIIAAKNDGLGYVSYYSDNQNLPKIKVNVPSGVVNGVFYTYKTTSQDWKQYLENNAYPKIDLVGYYTQLMFDKAPIKLYNYESPQKLVDMYDKITKSERELMGFFKYNKNFNTKQFVFTESKGGWHAGEFGVHLEISSAWGGPASSLSVDNLDLWGIAHELGHTNQVRPDIKWIGTTEVTNNIYSTWATYKLNKPGVNYIRLEDETGDATNYPKVKGNRYGEFLKHTLINKKNFNEITIDPHFRRSVPLWQISLYYQLAGALKGAPELAFDYDMSDELTANPPAAPSGIDYAHWHAFVAERARNRDASKLTDGELNMNFLKDVADAVQEDLTDFYTNVGFLTPVDITITDYSVTRLNVTQQMIDDVKTYIKSKNYPKPVSPVMHYLNSFNVNIFKNKSVLSGTTGLGANKITNTNGTFIEVETAKWPNAVAYETLDSKDQLISVSVLGTGDITAVKTLVDFTGDAQKVFAVGFDGKKIQVYPQNLSTVNVAENQNNFRIIPNPITNSSDVKISLDNAKGNYTLKVVDVGGNILLNSNGDINDLQKKINAKFKSLGAGIYIVTIENEINKSSQKIIKQ